MCRAASGQQPVAASPGRVLSEGRVPAAAPAGQAHVCDQLHGDGEGHRGPSLLPTDQGPADQGHLTATQVGFNIDAGTIYIPDQCVLEEKFLGIASLVLFVPLTNHPWPMCPDPGPREGPGRNKPIWVMLGGADPPPPFLYS